jgi:hypothetical protein
VYDKRQLATIPRDVARLGFPRLLFACAALGQAHLDMNASTRSKQVCQQRNEKRHEHQHGSHFFVSIVRICFAKAHPNGLVGWVATGEAN